MNFLAPPPLGCWLQDLVFSSQVSFVAPPLSLSNRKWSGNLFSTAPTDRSLNAAAVKLLQHFGWQRVAVVAAGGGDRLVQVNTETLGGRTFVER